MKRLLNLLLAAVLLASLALPLLPQQEVRAAPLLYENQSTNATNGVVWGDTWAGQTFSPLVTHNVTSADVLLWRVGNPGNVSLNITQLHPSWLGTSGQDNAYSLTQDADYIYAALAISPVTENAAQVIKIYKPTMTTTANWTGLASANQTRARGITRIGTKLYVVLDEDTTPVQIVELDSLTMTETGNWTAPPGYISSYSITNFGGYLYAGIDTPTSTLFKIDPATMTTTANWTTTDLIRGIVDDGTYLYVGVNGAPGKVIQLNPATMTTVATWTGAGGQNNPISLVINGGFVYAGLAGAPAQVIKINTSTMLTSANWTGTATEVDTYALATDGSFIYAGFYTNNPGSIVKLNISNMTTNMTWIGEKNNHNFLWDSTNAKLYVAHGTVPGRVIVIDPLTTPPTGFDGTILASGTTDGNTLPAGVPYEWRKVVFSSNPTLTVGIQYGMSISNPTGDGGANYVVFRYTLVDAYPRGDYYRSGNRQDVDMSFKEYGTYPLPSITTLLATGISMTKDGVTSGNFSGNVTDLGGGAPSVDYWWEFAKIAAFNEMRTSNTTGGLGVKTLAFSTSNLTPGGTLHTMLAASNADGTTYGSDQSFTLTMPSVSTGGYNRFSGDSSILNGSVIDMGVASDAYISFDWGYNTLYGDATTESSVNGVGTFTKTITHSPIKEVHYRAKVRVGTVYSYGADQTIPIDNDLDTTVTLIVPLGLLLILIFALRGGLEMVELSPLVMIILVVIIAVVIQWLATLYTSLW